YFGHIALVCRFFFSSRRRHTRSKRDWSSDVCSSDLMESEISDPVQSDFGFHIIKLNKKEETDEDFGDLEDQEEQIRRDIATSKRSEERRVGKECILQCEPQD